MFIPNKENYSLFIMYSHICRNFHSNIRSAVTNQLANLVQDPKVTIASDQIFLPKIA